MYIVLTRLITGATPAVTIEINIRDLEFLIAFRKILRNKSKYPICKFIIFVNFIIACTCRFQLQRLPNKNVTMKQDVYLLRTFLIL